MSAEVSIQVPADHPALAGHFPGNPVVPGSVILERILAACPLDGVRLDFIKFQRPLAPGRAAWIVFSPSRGVNALDFRCVQDDRPICAGRLSGGS